MAAQGLGLVFNTLERNGALMTMTFIWSHIRRTGQMMKARILLADDHPRFPEMEQHLLESEFEIVGKVANGQALLEEAVRLKPDVIVSDISMPILNGIEAADRLKESGCESRIVFLTVHGDADFVRRCLSTGAFGYRSEEHTSELQSRRDLVCRLLLEKKKRRRTAL